MSRGRPWRMRWNCCTRTTRTSFRSDGACGKIGAGREAGMDARWVREPRLVRVTGYGPLFDEGAYEQDGHIRIDFGSDAAFLEEDIELDATAAQACGRKCAPTGRADRGGGERFRRNSAAAVERAGREPGAAAGGAAGNGELEMRFTIERSAYAGAGGGSAAGDCAGRVSGQRASSKPVQPQGHSQETGHEYSGRGQRTLCSRTRCADTCCTRFTRRSRCS